MKLVGSLYEAELHILHWFRSGLEDVHGRRDGLRLGQYVWNMMGASGESWPELFYQPMTSKSIDMLYNYFAEKYNEPTF